LLSTLEIAGATYYPAYYQQPTSLMKPTTSFAPRAMRNVDAVKFLRLRKISAHSP
jgi:hypothetical protein